MHITVTSDGMGPGCVVIIVIIIILPVWCKRDPQILIERSLRPKLVIEKEQKGIYYFLSTQDMPGA